MLLPEGCTGVLFVFDSKAQAEEHGDGTIIELRTTGKVCTKFTPYADGVRHE